MNQGRKVQLSGPLLVELACIVVCTLLFLFTAAFSLVPVLSAGHQPGTRDYIEYWASGQQLVHHRNPYDAAAVFQLERLHGLRNNILPLVMGNAPPALLLTVPLGFLSARTGEIVWLLLLLGAFLASVRMIADMVAPKSLAVKVLGYSFAPAILCIAVGQMSLFVLLGVVIFLRLHKAHPISAGAALWLCLLKPQLFVPFGLVLFLWIWTRRQFRVLAGAAVAVGISALLIWMLDPLCWSQYRGMMQALRYDRAEIPCLSVVLRGSLPSIPFLQYVPGVVGSVWAVFYFWRHRERWDWIEQGSAILLLSLLVAPYTWFIDQCVALPPLLRGIAVTRSRMTVMALGTASAGIELSTLLKQDLMHSKSYLWTTPFYLLWYLIAVRQQAASDNRPAASAFPEAAACQTQAGV